MKKIHASLWAAATALLALGAHAQPVRAVTEDAPPYTFMAGSKVTGIATEVLEKTLQLAGIPDYRVNLYPWARAYDMALKEPNVLIFLIARTPARENQFQWVGEFMQMRYHLYKLRDRPNITASQLDSARSYVIGVIRDDVRQQYLQRQGFSRLVVSAQANDNFAKLLSHQVEMVPLTDAETAPLCRSAHFDCAGLEKVLTLDDMTTGLYMAYSKVTPESLVNQTRAAFEQLRANGTVRRIMAPPLSAANTTKTQ
jgi:polar amino acid transport system substrate-binding protein